VLFKHFLFICALLFLFRSIVLSDLMQFCKMVLEMAKYIGVTIFFIFVSRNILCHTIVPHPMHRLIVFARSPLVSGRYGTTWLLSQVHSIAVGTHEPGESIEVRVLDGAMANPHILSSFFFDFCSPSLVFFDLSVFLPLFPSPTYPTVID